MKSLHQGHIVVATFQQAELGGDIGAIGRQKRLRIALQAGLQRFDGIECRCQRLRQAGQVPVRDLWLLAETVATVLAIGRVRRPVGIEIVDPAVRAIVDGQAEDRHVVGVHHAVHESDPHPVRDHPRRAHTDLIEPVRAQAFAFAPQLGKITVDGEIDQLPEQGSLAARRGQLEIAEADEGWRDPADNGTFLRRRMAVVKHVANDILAGRQQAQGPRRRHAEMVHCFAAEELADRGAQHGAAIGAARIRRRPGTLELHFPALTRRVDDLAQGDGATVTQLPGPVAKLMSSIVGGKRLHACQQGISAENVGKELRFDLIIVKTKDFGHFRRVRNQAWRADRRWRNRRMQGTANLAQARAGFRIGGQFAEKSIVEMQSGKHVDPAAGRR